MHKLMPLNFVWCFHGKALFQRERMAFDHILWLLSNSNLYFDKRYVSTLNYFWLTLITRRLISYLHNNLL